MRVSFTLWEPALGKYSLNKIYAGRHHRQRMQDAEYWHSLVRAALLQQKIPKKPFAKPVKITFGWPGKLDMDNYAYIRKMIIDALKGWLVVDDTKRYITALVEHDKPGDKITIEIEEDD